MLLEMKSDRISEGTNFNGIDLLNGKMDGTNRIASTDVDLSANKVPKFSFTAEGGNVGTKIKFAAKAASGDSANAVEVAGAGDTLTITLDLGKNGTITEADINDAITKYLNDKGTAQDIKDTFKGMQVNISGDIKGDGADNSTTAAGTASAAGTATGSALSLQVGDTNENFQKVNVNVESMSAKSLGLDAIDISTQEGAGNAIEIINAAIEKVSTARSDLGAIRTNLPHNQ